MKNNETEYLNYFYRFLFGTKLAILTYTAAPKHAKEKIEKKSIEIGKEIHNILRKVSQELENANVEESAIILSSLFIANITAMASAIKPVKPTLDEIMDVALWITKEMLIDANIKPSEIKEMVKNTFIEMSKEFYKGEKEYI